MEIASIDIRDLLMLHLPKHCSQGRQILDVAFITNEVVDDLVYRNMEGGLCKLDTEKAYNHVNWSFLDYMLMRMRFVVKWRRWMKSRTTTTSLTMMVNVASSFFKPYRGLNQGDPLFPLLFIMVMKALNKMFIRARELELFRDLEVGVKEHTETIIHLFFTDDIMLFCELDECTVSISGVY